MPWPVWLQLTVFCGIEISLLEKPGAIHISYSLVSTPVRPPERESENLVTEVKYFTWTSSHIQKSVRRDPTSGMCFWHVSSESFSETLSFFLFLVLGPDTPWSSHHVVTTPSIKELDTFSNKLYFQLSISLSIVTPPLLNPFTNEILEVVLVFRGNSYILEM